MAGKKGKKMKELTNIVELVLAEYQKQNGEDAKLENGNWVAAELNNATVMLQIEDGELNVKITGEKPLKVDYQVSFYQDRREKMTNADKIRLMSDVELAEFLCKVKSDYQWMEHEFPSEEEHSEWEEWLQSEAEAKPEEMITCEAIEIVKDYMTEKELNAFYEDNNDFREYVNDFRRSKEGMTVQQALRYSVVKIVAKEMKEAVDGEEKM